MKIDIVVPWVDGSDEEWLKEKALYTPKTNSDDTIKRYRDWDLMRYWFRGIELFAPWVNRIHFITWGHIPDWLNTENEKLHIVKHSDYIPEQYLPVFSSHPLELNMHRIANLSDRFIYFNDDTFLLREVEESVFFKDGLPVDNVVEVPLRFFPNGIDHIIGNDMTIINKNFNKREVIKKYASKWFSPKVPVAMAKNIYMLPVNGFSAFDNPHLPIPYMKSVLQSVWDKEYDILNETSSRKFRSSEDVNQWLFRYWQFVNGQFSQDKGVQGRFFSIGRDDSLIKKAILNQEYDVVCLSDDKVEIDFEKERQFIKDQFEVILPQKSSFEKY